MCLALDHNAVTSARPEPGAPRSRVKHFTTESLSSLLSQCAVIELTKYLHLEKILYFLLKSVILPRNNYNSGKVLLNLAIKVSI